MSTSIVDADPPLRCFSTVLTFLSFYAIKLSLLVMLLNMTQRSFSKIYVMFYALVMSTLFVVQSIDRQFLLVKNHV